VPSQMAHRRYRAALMEKDRLAPRGGLYLFRKLERATKNKNQHSRPFRRQHFAPSERGEGRAGVIESVRDPPDARAGCRSSRRAGGGFWASFDYLGGAGDIRLAPRRSVVSGQVPQARTSVTSPVPGKILAWNKSETVASAS
jgi:hypothetical protein